MADPILSQACNPFQVSMNGSLQDVIVLGLAAEAVHRSTGPACLQVIRYHAGSGTYARMVRIEVSTPGAPTWSITPAGADDEIRLRRFIQADTDLRIRLVRAPDSVVAGLPDLSDFDFSLEAFG